MNWISTVWNGVSPCMEPGVGDCVVWWDAWAVAVAIAALLVAALNVGIAAVAAFAVYSLGRQANNVARVGLANGEAERARLDALSAAESEREEQVLLCFLSAEIAQARVNLRTLHSLLQTDIFSEANFIEKAVIRTQLAKLSKESTSRKLSSVISRLHAINPGTGMRLARLAGDLSSMQRDLAAYANSYWQVDATDSDEMVRVKTTGLRDGFFNVRTLIDRAAQEAVHLDDKAVRVARLLKIEENN